MTTGGKDDLKRWLLLAAEVALVIVILGLLALTWMPAIIGIHPQSGR